MPKEIEISALYNKFDVIANAPSSYEEGDTLVGEVGGVLKGFIADCSARNFLPRLYKTVSQTLETDGHARKVTGKVKKADGTEGDVKETHIVHIDRVHSEGDAELQAKIGELLRSTAASIPFYAEGERSGGGGKIAQGTLDAANGFFAEGPEKVEQIAGYIESAVPGFKVSRDSDGNPTPESLARALQALEKHLVNEAKKKSAAVLGGMGK